jgi:hypothetical protein
MLMKNAPAVATLGDGLPHASEISMPVASAHDEVAAAITSAVNAKRVVIRFTFFPSG